MAYQLKPNDVPFTGAPPSNATLGRCTGITELLPKSVPSSTPADGIDASCAPASAARRITTSCTSARLSATRITKAPLGNVLVFEVNEYGAYHTRTESVSNDASNRMLDSLPGAKA